MARIGRSRPVSNYRPIPAPRKAAPVGTANAGVAQCTAAAYDNPFAQKATATAAALQPTVSLVPNVSANAGLAAATAVALGPEMVIRALATATAYNPQFTTKGSATAAALGPMMVNTATATAAGLGTQNFTGGAAAVAAAYQPTIIKGGTAFPSTATATASAKNAPMITAQAIRAMATANAGNPLAYYGSTRVIRVQYENRTYQIPRETRVIAIGGA